MQVRTRYHADLERVWQSLYELADLAGTAMARAAAALADADRALAEDIIGSDTELDTRRARVEELVFTLLATQQPVAGDLRLLTSALPVAASLERMGDLAAHIARAANLRYPDHAVPGELHDTTDSMGQVAGELAGDVTTAIATRDAALAAGVPARDDAMDALRRRMFTTLLDPANHVRTDTAVDMSLLGRYYERYADQAVSVARRIHYTLTGQQLESGPV
jgi:phosphate transport system protein